MLISNQRLINWQPFKQNALEDKRGWDRFIFFRSGSPMSCNVGRTVVNPCSPQMAWPGLAWPGLAWAQVIWCKCPQRDSQKGTLSIYNIAFTYYTHRHELWISGGYLVSFPGLPLGDYSSIGPVLSRADSVLSSPRLSPNNFHHPEQHQSREFSSGYCPILSASDAPDEMCATYPWGVKRNHLIITFTSLPQLHGQGGVSADWPDSCSASDRVLRQRHTHSAVPRWLSFSPLPWPVHL